MHYTLENYRQGVYSKNRMAQLASKHSFFFLYVLRQFLIFNLPACILSVYYINSVMAKQSKSSAIPQHTQLKKYVMEQDDSYPQTRLAHMHAHAQNIIVYTHTTAIIIGCNSSNYQTCRLLYYISVVIFST